MITNLLLLNTIDFAVYVVGAFVFFSASLLFFDSWKLKKSKKSPLVRSFGFLLLSLVYASYASSTQMSMAITATQILKILAITIILLSLVVEPVLHKPNNKAAAFMVPLSMPALAFAMIPLSAALFLCVSIWYLFRSTKGLDKQLKPAAFAFFFLALSEFVKISFAWGNTMNVFWAKILAVHSWVWETHILLQLVGITILGLWVWGYIRFRLQIQIFTTILASIFTIFLVTTFFFSFLLLRNIENDALSYLKTDANVFQYTLDRLQLESLSHARAIAADSSLKESLIKKNQDKLYDITSKSLIDQNLATLLVASSSGEVVMRAEDKDNTGQNFSEDTLISSALSGHQLSTFILNENPIVPEVFVKSAVPITSESNITGVIETGFIIDNAFVDGVKEVTGLDATVFANDQRVATTIIAPDGKSRFTGTMETDDQILDTVLNKGEAYVGASEILNEPYYTAYTPLKSYGDKTIGMLFIGRPQIELSEIAQRSINSTFLGSIIMMVVAIIPAYFVSKYVKENIEA